jgi:hypothetical protein
MPYQEWRGIDDKLYRRRHDRDTCDQCQPVTPQTDHLDPVEAELDRVTSKVYDPSQPFVLAEWSSPGDPLDWVAGLWEAWQVCWKQLPEEHNTRVVDDCLARMSPNDDEDYGSEGLTSKPIHDMTDDEWMAMSESFGEVGYTELQKAIDGGDALSVLSPVKFEPGPIAVQPECDCNGPGAVEEKWTTHEDSCPAYVWEACTCTGPGSRENKFSSHVSCPFGKSSTLSTYKPSCTHDRQKFKLEDGLVIFASAYRDVKDEQSDEVDLGVYLYDSWAPTITTTPSLDVPWAPKYQTQGVFVDWPDFGVPRKETPVVEMTQWMLAKIESGLKVETACMGGHGRTGTMLAMLLVAQGVTPPDAIERVRTDHCKKAIENNVQAEYVADFYRTVHGNSEWRKSKTERKRFARLAEAGHKNSTWKSPFPVSSKPTTNGSGIMNFGFHKGGDKT